MNFLDRIKKALAAFNENDFDTINDEIGHHIYRYRIRKVGKLWEPQMLHTTGANHRIVWFPLAENGYWLEPNAYSYGEVTARSLMSHEEAERSIICAKRINEEPLLKVV